VSASVRACGCACRRLQVFQVDIRRLSIEPSENCAGDRLQLFDGDEDTPLSEPMCGQDPPSETFTSRSSVLVVRFQSDQGGTDAGFVLQYAVVAAELDQADVQAATDQPTGSQGDARVGHVKSGSRRSLACPHPTTGS